jgi:hypothetical protein
MEEKFFWACTSHIGMYLHPGVVCASVNPRAIIFYQKI